jgi:hypothetical protein
MAELSEEEFRELMGHAGEGHTEIVLEAVDRDRGLLARANQHGGRLLDRAAWFGRADLVRELLDRGADIHARDNDGTDAVMWACFSVVADLATVTLLLDRGANLLAVDYNAESALHLAARKGYMDICLLLLSRGADLMAVDNWGHTALDDLSTVNPQTGRYCSEQEQEARRYLLRAAFEEGPHISQKRRRAWERRKNAMMVMAGCGFQPLKARRELELEMNPPLPPDVPIPAQAVETEEEERALRRMSVFGNDGIWKHMVSFM